MSKSKKNTIDPEKMIAEYGADSVIFILSDSPPEKDVQWSEQGIVSSYKFIQKLWILNKKIFEKIKKNENKSSNKEIEKFTNKFIKKITDNLESFHYNVIIANMHEMYTFLSREIDKDISKKELIENYSKILIIINPIIPHLSNECLEMIDKIKNISWPTYDKKYLIEDKSYVVIQINGKKRGVIEIDKDTDEKTILSLAINDQKILKYLENNKIKKNIYVKNKIMNLII